MTKISDDLARPLPATELRSGAVIVESVETSESGRLPAGQAFTRISRVLRMALSYW